jgi:hypothetical protein
LLFLELIGIVVALSPWAKMATADTISALMLPPGSFLACLLSLSLMKAAHGFTKPRNDLKAHSLYIAYYNIDEGIWHLLLEQAPKGEVHNIAG